MTNRRRYMQRLQHTALSIVIISLWGCASIPKQESALVFVDGEPITKKDIEYSLQIAHRRENLSTTTTLDISQYIQKQIDDRLIIQETRRMGMDKFPEILEKVRAYVLRESVSRLYNEEVINKAIVTEEDINDYYKKNYMRYVVDAVELDTEQDAKVVMEKLKSGESFKELSLKDPVDFPKQEGDEHVLARNSLKPDIEKVIDNLRPGELSDITKINDKYLIIKLIGIREAPPEELNDLRKSIESTLKPQKIQERSDEYLAQLNEKANVKINQELLSSITFNQGSDEREMWLKDQRPLIEVGGEVLTVGGFTALLQASDEATKKNILKRWLDRKIVDQAALKRNYEAEADFRDEVRRYQDENLKNIFAKNIIAPKIKIENKEVNDYYLSHQDAYTKPVNYKIQQITVKTPEDAQQVLDSLKGGASFLWLAKTRSTDYLAEKGGILGWKTKAELDDPEQEIIDTLEPGDVSPVMEIENNYRVIRLMEKTGKEVKELSEIKDLAFRSVYREKFREILTDYIDKLKKEARIEMNEKAIREFEGIFKK
ncbi:MAG: peptidyl-prolyl cis-trans isomerase [Nitrospirae bacterium]|nr:peptidyl-prolyl cis-trans isomerase [Nitrospirota bacterium]